jgi:hypothetical protein
MDRDELNTSLDLFKFYMELILKGAGFSLGITGALVSYVLGAEKNGSPSQLALLVPLLMNGGFSAICFMSVGPARALARHVNPEFDIFVLPRMLKLFGTLFMTVALGLAVLTIWRPGPS